MKPTFRKPLLSRKGDRKEEVHPPPEEPATAPKPKLMRPFTLKKKDPAEVVPDAPREQQEQPDPEQEVVKSAIFTNRKNEVP